MWSIGVIAFFLLAGIPPFLGKDDKEIAYKIMSCDYDFSLMCWKSISKNAKNWIDKMLIPEPE